MYTQARTQAALLHIVRHVLLAVSRQVVVMTRLKYLNDNPPGKNVYYLKENGKGEAIIFVCQLRLRQ